MVPTGAFGFAASPDVAPASSELDPQGEEHAQAGERPPAIRRHFLAGPGTLLAGRNALFLPALLPRNSALTVGWHGLPGSFTHVNFVGPVPAAASRSFDLFTFYQAPDHRCNPPLDMGPPRDVAGDHSGKAVLPQSQPTCWWRGSTPQ